MDRLNLTERAAEILETANLLSKELAQGGFTEPSFEYGLPDPLHDNAPDSKAGAARQKLLQILDELRSLVTEPALTLTVELVSFVVYILILILNYSCLPSSPVSLFYCIDS